jgi:hypothetical protein
MEPGFHPHKYTVRSAGNVSIPLRYGHIERACRSQTSFHTGYAAVDHVDAQHRLAMSDRSLPRRRTSRVETRTLENIGQSARHVTRDLTELRRQRTGRHQRRARHDARRCGDDHRADLANPRRRPGIFDLRARRCAHYAGERLLFVVVARDDRQRFRGDPDVVHRPSATCRRFGIREQGKHERMRHPLTVDRTPGYGLQATGLKGGGVGLSSMSTPDP